MQRIGGIRKAAATAHFVPVVRGEASCRDPGEAARAAFEMAAVPDRGGTVPVLSPGGGSLELRADSRVDSGA